MVFIHDFALLFVLVFKMLGFMRKLYELDSTIHEETLGEDKGKERCLGCSSGDCSCAMLGFSLVMNMNCDIHANLGGLNSCDDARVEYLGFENSSLRMDM